MTDGRRCLGGTEWRRAHRWECGGDRIGALEVPGAIKRAGGFQKRAEVVQLYILLCTFFMLQVAAPSRLAEAGTQRELLISILGVTVEDKKLVGAVANLLIVFEERNDHSGLAVHFRDFPGRFSPMAQTAVQQAIYRIARAAGLSTDSWTVILAVPHPGITIYGDSLSAMVGLSVVALANGDVIPPDRVATGTVSVDGRITPVGSVPLKIEAAYEAQFRRVVVPDELDVTDGDWRTPFLAQISPVGTVNQAYQALTDHPLPSPGFSAQP